ncbi:hypothetical protein Fmac_001517 [Flemingia macrophylla]|uniref:Uncharacterized protein n=1 Tax=Flemingia macrophylla TaxID=520843 RepID=A0ABD1NHA8_9FABA
MREILHTGDFQCLERGLVAEEQHQQQDLEEKEEDEDEEDDLQKPETLEEDQPHTLETVNHNAEANGAKEEEENEDLTLDEEPVEKLLEPFTKEQLHSLVKQAVEKARMLKLNKETKDGDVVEKVLIYQHANKQVNWIKNVLLCITMILYFVPIPKVNFVHLSVGNIKHKMNRTSNTQPLTEPMVPGNGAKFDRSRIRQGLDQKRPLATYKGQQPRSIRLSQDGTSSAYARLTQKIAQESIYP